MRVPRPPKRSSRANAADRSSDWAGVVAAQVERLAQEAARPASGFVPAAAEAVLFRDSAEVLACLARDWMGGGAEIRWWWRCLFPGMDLPAALRAAWLGSPAALPAALDALASDGAASAVLSRFEPHEIRLLLDGVLETFGLYQLGHALRECWRLSERPAGASSPELVHESGELPRAMPLHESPVFCPWARWVQCDPLLPLESQGLLITCVLLRRDPGFVRSSMFTESIQSWLGATGGDAEPAKDTPLPAPANGRHALPRRNERAPAQATELPARQTSMPAGSETFNLPMTPAPPTPTPMPEPLAHPLSATGKAADSTATGGKHLASVDLGSTSSAPGLEASAIHTEWGGLFYLVNVALSLELYGDFTMPARPGLAMTVWDFLALLGRRFIGEALEKDPLWGLLAQLSGRAIADPVCRWFQPPDAWRLPAAWLKSFDSLGEWKWSATAGRLRLRHPKGFEVLDVALADDASRTGLEAELKALSLDPNQLVLSEADAGKAPNTSALAHWLDWLTPYIEARLVLALNSSDASAALELTLRHRARIEVTAERVEVFFALAQHPIELRLAGLDRDPGWVPAAGRTLAFQYD